MISSIGETKSNTENRRLTPVLIAVTVILLGIFIFGLRWIFSLGAEGISNTSFLLFDYGVGLTMIFLPCTLPLAFVIVPLVMGRSYFKGIGMALAFGLGVTITLSVYGIFIGLLGQALGINQVELAKNILYALAGFFAIFFALGELGFTKFTMPTFSGIIPDFVQKRRDFFKAGLLGLFLGNVGVGCPNPLFNIVIIPQIIVTGDVFQGWLIMAVQALGRITPLLILAFLAILGFNATKFLLTRQESVKWITGWFTVFIGGFLFTLGVFTHDWWVYSGMHTALEFLTQESWITNILAGKVSGVGHTHGLPAEKSLIGLPIEWGTWVMLGIWIFPMYWYWSRKKREILTLPQEGQEERKRCLNLNLWFITLFSILLVVIFGWILPHQFKAHWSAGMAREEHEELSETRTKKFLPAKPLDTNDISRRASDIPPPIKRRENQMVIVELETKEVIAELAPGVTYEYWTYNGTVPGPFIRVKEKDTVEIRLIHSHDANHHSSGHQNHSFAIDSFFVSPVLANEDRDHAMDEHAAHTADEHAAAGHAFHSIDLHAVLGPGGGAGFTKVGPGETKSFQFKALRPGIYVYHCAGEHIPTHIANGMYGMILVEPKEGLLPVDREFYVMQGELYTKGKFGEKGHQAFDLEKLKQERPEYFVFNGRVGALTKENALKAKVGETIRIFFGVGPHIASNFHIIGGILDRLYPEGDILSPPHRNVQTTIVPPGGAIMTEFKLEIPGKYFLVDHSLSRAIDKGALGEIIVVGEDHPEIFKKIEE